MSETKNPNILEYIEEMMEQGYSEEDAALMWHCLFSDCFESEE